MQYVEQKDISSLPDGLEIGREVTLPFYTVDFNFILVSV